MSTINELVGKLQRELKLRKYANSSIDTYSSCLRVFLSQHKKFNSYQDIEDVKSFLLTISNSNYHKQMVATIHHFFGEVLRRPLTIFDIPYPRKTHYLPEILSLQEVYRMIGTIKNIKQKAIIQLMYSCALRIGEIVKLKLPNIDSDRMLVLVKGAKGFKDRYVPLPMPTLQLLRSYYKLYYPHKWLFEGQFHEEYSVRSIQLIFHRAIKEAKIYKRVTPHCLRHSRLTHLKEAGVDIHELKLIAGHNNIKTTEIYLHLAKESLVNRVAMADQLLASIIETKKIEYH